MTYVNFGLHTFHVFYYSLELGQKGKLPWSSDSFDLLS